MKPFKLLFPLLVFAFSLIALPSSVLAVARKKGAKSALAGGSFSMGFGISLLTAEQNGLNSLIASAKAQAPGGGVSTGDLSSGMEYSGQFTFHFSNDLVSIQLRPSYFTQSASGSGTDGDYSYKLTGFTIFPLVRITPLSNDIINFYLQSGIGYGQLRGDITNGPRNVSFVGSDFGIQIGLGADFCLTPENCFGIEGNYRYLPMQRNIVRSSSALAPYGVSQAIPDRELEDASGKDIATTMNGISGNLNYTFNF